MSTPVSRAPRQARWTATNGTDLSQFATLAGRLGFCQRGLAVGRETEVSVPMGRSLHKTRPRQSLADSWCPHDEAGPVRISDRRASHGVWRHTLRVPVLALRMALCLRSSAR